MATKKLLFKGVFNYAGESYEMYSHAISEEWAFLNFTTRLARRIKYFPSYVRGYFSGSKDNYHIEEVKGDEQTISRIEEESKEKGIS